MGMTQQLLIPLMTWAILAYFVALNLGYLALNLLSLASLYRGRQEKVLEELPQVFTGLDPAISILVPAYNEQAGISASIHRCSWSR